MKIDNYEFGSITIDGKVYNHDVIIFKSEVRSWWREQGHSVSIKDIENVVKDGAKKVIFGTGAMGVMKVQKETEDYLIKNGIEVLKFKTPDAVKKFNEISSIDVAGAFHLTC